MTREEFIKKIAPYFGSQEEAEEVASDFTDEELLENGQRLEREIREDYKYACWEDYYGY